MRRNVFLVAVVVVVVVPWVEGEGTKADGLDKRENASADDRRKKQQDPSRLLREELRELILGIGYPVAGGISRHVDTSVDDTRIDG